MAISVENQIIFPTHVFNSPDEGELELELGVGARGQKLG